VKLRIEDITAQTREAAFSNPAADINRLLQQGPVHEYTVEDSLSVAVHYSRSGMDLVFEGNLSATLRAVCARCTEGFPVETERQFRFVLVPRAVGDMAESDLHADDLEFSEYQGDQVDLSPFIREQLLLALPTRPICRDDCRGLCPRCGANLNDEGCACPASTPDPRFAILNSVKVRRP
jgi:uncharacterized protein